MQGRARGMRDEEVFELVTDQSTHIPLGTVHRLENVGEKPLLIIEVQSGSYLGEDNIVRIEDKYGRNSTGLSCAAISGLAAPADRVVIMEFNQACDIAGPVANRTVEFGLHHS